jgi:hypothetical protein
MTRAQFLDLLRAHRYTVRASGSAAGKPQAKAQHLCRHATIVLVFGGTAPCEERPAQIEGVAVCPKRASL